MTAVVTLRVARVADTARQVDEARLNWLSLSERARLAAITAPRRRAQFLAGRWTLRHLLADAYGGCALADWQLTAQENSPPGLPSSAQGPSLRLSISHSHDWVACAASVAEIGLDIEVAQRRRNVRGLTRAICTDAEQQHLLALGPEDARARFYVMWTLKEAWLKQRCEGVSLGRLARLEARESKEPEANARVWAADGITLALVAPPGAPLQLDAGSSFLRTTPSGVWRVHSSDN